jgi:hypothetical protein
MLSFFSPLQKFTVPRARMIDFVPLVRRIPPPKLRRATRAHQVFINKRSHTSAESNTTIPTAFTCCGSLK